jgi:hypothetical protein
VSSGEDVDQAAFHLQRLLEHCHLHSLGRRAIAGPAAGEVTLAAACDATANMLCAAAIPFIAEFTPEISMPCQSTPGSVA